ncbi:hypothetical protein [Nocardioides sp. InS609-2]|uniref:hypothetical protein n=1 Tax=Nocardioides sp. InS609-2 TaxID=2760705 RepID=UPI0020BDAD03|nr:hypothetical protein [Nocardioides sp. InS609-2]
MSAGNPLTAVSMKAARWSAAHPWRAILGWLALVVVAVGLATAIPTVETSDADYRMGESGRADQLVAEAGLDGLPSENVLITGKDGVAPHRAVAQQAAAAVADAVRPLEGVAEVVEPQWSPDSTALLVAVQLAKEHDEAGRSSRPSTRSSRSSRAWSSARPAT